MPPFCNKRIAIATVKNEIITPKQKFKACNLTFLVEPPPIETKLSAFRDMIGKTQGIIFKISPPIKAKIKACHTEIDSMTERDDSSSSETITKDSSLITKIPSTLLGPSLIRGILKSQLFSSLISS